MEHFGAPLRLL